MRKHNRIELEIGSEDYVYQGITHSRPAAFVIIDTTDEVLLDKIISALSHVEALEV